MKGENNGIKATVKIWTDVFRSVAHIDIDAIKKYLRSSYESWRYQDRVIKARENFANSWKWAAPKNNVYKQNIISVSKTMRFCFIIIIRHKQFLMQQ